LDHHKTVTKQIQVVAGQLQDITLSPIPKYGSLDIVSTPHDATITIDGEEVGKTPFTIEKLLEGEHTVAISKEGYSVFKKVVNITENNTETVPATMEKRVPIANKTTLPQGNAQISINKKNQELNVKSFIAKTNDITARTQPRQDINGNDCALVKVQIVGQGVTFSGNVVDVNYKGNEYWVYMPNGSKRLKITHPDYLPMEVLFDNYGIGMVQGKNTYVLTVVNSNQSSTNVENKLFSGYVNILSDRKLQSSDIDGKSKKELEILRNMIYAKYGYRFKRDDLFKYFSQYEWYHPITSDASDAYSRMSSIEHYNIDFIKKFER
jgi:hypothetical protein